MEERVGHTIHVLLLIYSPGIGKLYLDVDCLLVIASSMNARTRVCKIRRVWSLASFRLSSASAYVARQFIVSLALMGAHTSLNQIL